MAIKQLLSFSHPICKEAEKAWSEELKSNSKLKELDEEMLDFFADGFIEGYTNARIKQDKQAIWTDYDKRFQVLIIGDSFQLYDMAEEVSLGEYETEEEAHNEKDDHIKEAEFQNRYENNSGR